MSVCWGADPTPLALLWVLADAASRSASQLRKKESKAACFAKEGGIANGFAKDGGIARGFTKKVTSPKKVASPKNGAGDKCVVKFHLQYCSSLGEAWCLDGAAAVGGGAATEHELVFCRA